MSTSRQQTWDYAWDGAYFITICTKNREHYFGEIVEGNMRYSHLGTIANVLWYEIKNHFQMLELREFQIMPNHLHGILVLNSENLPFKPEIISKIYPDYFFKPNTIVGQKRFQNPGKNSISTIIGSYKSAVSKHANRLELTFGWQPSFHDHIICDANEYYKIANYILNNPQNWKDDKFY